ncbi:mechanosensitive ion channel family protein [Candidatus Woesearchaeota archaeon]|nr:mechanosensitive ion channel family protein [Candidatus Woesearchaeota archaeon]
MAGGVCYPEKGVETVLKEFFLNFIASQQFLIWRRLAAIVIIILITFMLAGLVNKLMKRTFQKIIKRRLEHPEIPTDTTKFVVLRRVIQVLVYLMGFAAIVYAIPEFRALSYSILAGAGVAAVIVGFAAQKAFANIMSGIFLAVSEPIRVGDRVTINDNYGIIEDITLRHTVIKTWDNNRVIIPNAVMNEVQITNHSIVDERIIQTLEVGISYDSDIELAKKIIIEEIRKHPGFLTQYDPTGYVKPETAVTVRVMEYGDSAVKLKAYFWTRDKLTGFVMEKDLLESVKKRFDKEGVEIPYPYRMIVYKTDVGKKTKKGRKKR